MSSFLQSENRDTIEQRGTHLGEEFYEMLVSASIPFWGEFIKGGGTGKMWALSAIHAVVLAPLIIRSKNSPLSLFGGDHDAFHMPFLRTDVRSSHNNIYDEIKQSNEVNYEQMLVE